ncbi:hypothetical protein C7974DRAFT_441826 [Boeremia exigua]|uniref:uncharacterized protein n=1 Tax=Boeremia exigua TaxID=749465 RepID=UPI001E8ECD67|nr:uncharacterized protein C7974DRAFT_441826 [Boeremia exigua]KAH6616255.1 hypothetical protein C7974DRAFT_441826 [Boeremia exigua]
MSTLAIAGGSSASLGRALTAALLSSRTSPAWNAVILSRSPNPPSWLRAMDPDSLRTQVRTVDYLSTESLTTALKGVHTVVSVTSAIDGTQGTIQINLLKAALEAGCKRFAPAQWGFGFRGWENVSSTKWAFEGVWEECEKHCGEIECARFNHGSFMNYIGHGIFPVPAKVDKDTLFEEMKKGGGYAAGEDAAIQGLASMVGDTVTMGELVAHAEAVTGQKMQVKAITKAEVEKQMSELDEHNFMGMLWSEFRLAYIRDDEDEVILRPILNKLCPDVKPVSIRKFMETHWQAI